jgi:hypothetical protein
MTEFSQTYWNDLLDKYRNGTITEQDRFQLEKQALDDPFLFDALEGFSLIKEESKENRKASKLFTIPRMAIAASLVLLLAFIFNLESNLNNTFEEDQSIAMVLEKDQGIESESEEITNIEEAIKVDDEPNAATSEPSQKVSNKPSKPLNAKKDRSSSSVTKNSKTELAEIISPKPPTVIGEKANEIVDADEKREEEIVEDKKEEELVILENEENVLDEVVAPQNEGESVEIVNAGSFEKVEQEAKSGIAPLGSLSKKREDTSENLSEKEKNLAIYKAVPVIGKEFFDDYAKQKIDERGFRQEKPQEVVIEFKIDENGNLSDFHYIYSGLPECGAFAIALLTNSGEWKTVPPGGAGKARYTFIF